MENLSPVATESATQTVFFTNTGIEKAFTFIGMGTVTLLALLGSFTIVKAIWKNNVSIKKIG